MKKDWKTTILGALTGVTMIANTLSSAGMHVGHWGSSDWLSVTAGIGAVLLGKYASDSK